ncbi:MAG: hypothetical protein M3Q57_06490 [Pseudomonadota bacterium]|nr:hypothetical protein [Pseudomonadota bacterium]
MPSDTGPDKSKENPTEAGLEKDENVAGIPGKEAHGGDVAPANADDAGRRQSPESGPPERA